MTNLDPLSIPTVQAAIEQADRMARLEMSMLAIPRELQALREDGDRGREAILKEVSKTNGSVAQAIRDRDADRLRLAAVELDAHQAMALAAEASAAVSAIETERSQDGLVKNNQQLVNKTRWDFAKAQIRGVSLVVGLLGGVAGKQVIDFLIKQFS